MELIICEKWRMPLPERNDDNEWFLDWVLKAPHQRSTPAGWAAYQALAQVEPQMDVVFEFFGGLGTQSMMIKELWDPEIHVALDYAPESVAHLRETLPDVQVVQGDAYDAKWKPVADLITLDFGDFTIWKSREGQQHRGLLDKVFAENPKGVVMTDIAGRYLHLHRQRYETLVGAGRCGSYPDYLEALADRFEALYGYTMVGGFWHGHLSVSAFAQRGDRAAYAQAPANPVGLEIVQ